MLKCDGNRSINSNITCESEALHVDEVDDKVALMAFVGELKLSKFLFYLEKAPSKSMVELMIKPQKYFNAEDVLNARRDN